MYFILTIVCLWIMFSSVYLMATDTDNIIYDYDRAKLSNKLWLVMIYGPLLPLFASDL